VVTGYIGRVSATEKCDHRIEASVGKGQKVVPISLPTNVNALTAQHAAERIIGEESEVDFLVNVPLNELQRPRFQTNLEMFGDTD
jgi:hypothetical protein